MNAPSRLPSRLPRPRFDDDEGAPQPINSKTKKREVVGGVCNPPQTMAAIDRSGRGRNRQQPSFDSPSTSGKTRQARPKGRAARKKEQQELKAAKKGGRR